MLAMRPSRGRVRPSGIESGDIRYRVIVKGMVSRFRLDRIGLSSTSTVTPGPSIRRIRAGRRLSASPRSTPFFTSAVLAALQTTVPERAAAGLTSFLIDSVWPSGKNSVNPIARAKHLSTGYFDSEAISMKAVFVNPEEGRLRTGWRIVAFASGLMALNAVMFVSVRAILGSLPRQSILPFLIFGFVTTVSVFAARRFLDQRSIKSLGLHIDKHAILDLVGGMLISALVMAVMFFALLWAGLIEFQGFAWWTDDPTVSATLSAAALPAILLVMCKLAIVAWWEELVFRGYLFQNTVPVLGLTGSIVLLSLVFGVLHGMNPNATVLSTVLIALITPQLVYAYLKTGQLWLPIGIHWGWNLFQASVFGFSASGQASPTMIAQSPTGPDWLSGGTFGAEGSVLILPVTLLSMVVIHYWVRATRDRHQRPFQMLADYPGKRHTTSEQTCSYAQPRLCEA